MLFFVHVGGRRSQMGSIVRSSRSLTLQHSAKSSLQFETRLLAPLKRHILLLVIIIILSIDVNLFCSCHGENILILDKFLETRHVTEQIDLYNDIVRSTLVTRQRPMYANSVKTKSYSEVLLKGGNSTQAPSPRYTKQILNQSPFEEPQRIN